MYELNVKYVQIAVLFQFDKEHVQLSVHKKYAGSHNHMHTKI